MSAPLPPEVLGRPFKPHGPMTLNPAMRAKLLRTCRNPASDESRRVKETLCYKNTLN